MQVYTTKSGARIKIEINGGWLADTNIETYMCMQCGYMETYFPMSPPEVKNRKHWELAQKTHAEQIEGLKDNWRKL